MSSDRKSSAGTRRARLTGGLLVALVIVPGLVLGWMAIQASDREEAVIEKQLQTALLAEVAPAADRVAVLLTTLSAELDSTVPDSAALANAGADPFGFTRSTSAPSPPPSGRPTGLDGWREKTPLVGIPFVFQRPAGRFLWPRPDSRAITGAEADFLQLNLDFFQDRKVVEVYQNVAVQYADRMESKKDAGDDKYLAESKGSRRQQVLSEFERNEEFRNRLYDEAEKSGQNVLERDAAASEPALSKSEPVKGAKTSRSAKAEEAVSPSPFVTESLRFSQILADADEGWIPRLVDDQLQLLYWKRLGDDRILGCAVEETALRDRILEVLPTALTPARILVALDHTGKPLFDPTPETPRTWRASFVSREISEFLPRWEVAAYLTDPGVISERARTRTLTIWLLVGVLVVSIMTGGLVVSRMLRSELRLAEQKTTFVANVSHELKTPLTSIRLLSEMLRDGRAKDPEKQRKYLDIVVSETERLTRLINNVLDFSRLGREAKQYAPRPLDLVPLCAEMVETQLVRLTHAGFSVESTLAEGEAWVTADPEAIRQALLNLLSNAEKYSPDEKWIRVALRTEGGNAVVSVADHGVGVRPRDAERIFEEFYRADDSLTADVRGTGLGLTLSRRLIEDQGGRLLYSPNTPKGSVFELRLPLGQAPEAELRT